MEIFARFNPAGGGKCPVCGTADSKETVLVPIHGTQRDGLSECNQYHLACIDLLEQNIDGKRVVSMFFFPKEAKMRFSWVLPFPKGIVSKEQVDQCLVEIRAQGWDFEDHRSDELVMGTPTTVVRISFLLESDCERFSRDEIAKELFEQYVGQSLTSRLRQ